MFDDAPLRTVRLVESTITLAPIDEVRAEAGRLEGEADTLAAVAVRLRADATARFVEAGMILAGRPGEWAPAQPAATAPLADAMRTIKALDDHAAVTEARAQAGPSGLFGRRKPLPETPEERQAREELGSRLTVMLVELGRAFGTALPAVEQVHGQAREMEAQAAIDEARADELRGRARLLRQEVDARLEATAQTGFDTLFTAAQLLDSGPPPMKSPLDLHPGEQVFLVQPAELARQKAAASTGAGTQGLVFPISHTGIPYLVGSHRGQVLKLESLARLGSGSFVVTSRRLGFVGDLKSFSFPLATLRHAVQYGNGLLLVREGRENGDFLLTESAGAILFHINYVLQL